MTFVSAILLAAGRGRRLKSGIPKLLIGLKSKPVIIYSLEALNTHPWIKEIILVANPLNFNRLKILARKYRIGKVKKIVLGGSQRRDSVSCGLKAVDPKAGAVLIHDAARPFIDKATISSVIRQAARSGAAIAGVPVKATIKKVASGQWPVASRIVEKTIDRSSLWEIQTPQVFKKDLILEAYRRFGKTPATDDAMLVEKSGRKVRVVMGSYSNIKITTPEDLILAKLIAQRWNTA